mgnify:CR=1 FL=1
MLSENSLVNILGEVNAKQLIALDKLGKLNANMDISQLPFCLRVVLESNLRHSKSEQELKSTVDNPHPLFVNFVAAALSYSKKK